MKRNRVLGAGCGVLCFFCISTAISILYLLFGFCGLLPFKGNIIDEPAFWAINLISVIMVESLVFWVGILMVYTTSIQLGLRWRLIGIICGWIPIVHLITLGIIISICSSEYKFEKNKFKLNDSRKHLMICNTRYPVLMVHGVFFRDFKHFNYWGRIPEELEKNGARVFYGNHNSAASVDNSAVELEARIKQIIQETGCEKVNIVAHSKGGLDARTAVAKTSIAPYVASITTINTPHRGCEFADYLLTKIGDAQQQAIANAYNTAAAKLGDVNPDFLAAVYDLSFANCARRNEEVFDVPGIYYQSFGSKLNSPISGRFPLNMTYNFVKSFDGPNDGLVGEKSFPWGANYCFLTVPGARGLSHGDLIDLNRENIKGFDVREFYVQLVADLKNRGL